MTAPLPPGLGGNQEASSSNDTAKGQRSYRRRAKGSKPGAIDSRNGAQEGRYTATGLYVFSLCKLCEDTSVSPVFSALQTCTSRGSSFGPFLLSLCLIHVKKSLPSVIRTYFGQEKITRRSILQREYT